MVAPYPRNLTPPPPPSNSLLDWLCLIFDVDPRVTTGISIDIARHVEPAVTVKTLAIGSAGEIAEVVEPIDVIWIVWSAFLTAFREEVTRIEREHLRDAS